MGYYKEIPTTVGQACAKQHTDVAEWAMKEFYDGWQKATAEHGLRWRTMWFEWNDRDSIYADGYLAACDYFDEVGWPEEQHEPWMDDLVEDLDDDLGVR